MSMSDSQISEILSDLKKDLDSPQKRKTIVPQGGSCCSGSNSYGVFDDVNEAIEAAGRAQNELMKLTLVERGKLIEAMRQATRDNAVKLSEMAVAETGYGHVEHKIAKHLLVANKTPGIEDLRSMAVSGDDGLMLTEMAPYGVIGSITPSTNPSATVINNAISMISAGNAVVFNPHPGAKNVSLEAIRLMNEAIVKAGGPDNLLCAPKNPTLDTSAVIMSHPKIRMLSVTGGEAVVGVAMKSGKKCIAAGPGNPPVVVDRTAIIKNAARDIVAGAYYENDILCIAEKEVLVEDVVADELIRGMVSEGAYLANSSELKSIVNTVMITTKEGKTAPNRKFVGKNASYILRESGIPTNKEYKIIIAEVPFEHPLVMTEMLMPVIPVTRVSDVDEAIEKAVIAENGCHHTAMMHSQNVENLTKMAKAIDTSIFVKNAPSYAGLGLNGEGFTTLTIATPTGEGLTSARSFTRLRRCTLYGSFRII